ncbi:MAG: hypothetical protein ACOY3P_08650 [Planctomycetota bacterium]
MRLTALSLCVGLLSMTDIAQTANPQQDSVLSQDVISGRMRGDLLDPAKNSYRYEGDTKSSTGAKDNVYPEILPPHVGEQLVSFEDLNFGSSQSNLNASFFTSGEKIYEVGTMRGAFLKRGLLWGDESGVWSQPFKLLDGVLLEIVNEGGDTWTLNGARRFTNRLTAVDLEFRRGPLTVTRTDFAVHDEYAFFYLVKLRNGGEDPCSFTFRFTFQENIRPIWHKPWTVSYGEDQIQMVRDGVFVAWDRMLNRTRAGQDAPATPTKKPKGKTKTKATQELDSHLAQMNWERSRPGEVAIAFGAVEPPDRRRIDARNPYRNRGILEYDLRLEPGEEKQLDFLAVMYDSRKMNGPRESAPQDEAEVYFERLRGKSSVLMEEKIAAWRPNITGGVRFECPDKAIQDAFVCAKFNMQALSMDLRPFYEHRAIMTCPERAYQKVFGIDSQYATIGTAYAGLTDIARENLRNIHFFAGRLNFTGIPVAISQFGTIGEATPLDGRAQEGTQYIGTAWEFLKLTGDYELLRYVYPGLKRIHAAYRKRDSNDDLWPEGMTFPGLTQSVREAAGTQDVAMISAAVRIWWATDSLAQMAEVLGKHDDAKLYRDLSARMKEAFRRQWWIDERGVWAVALAGGDGNRRQIFLSYKNAPINYPQKYGLAEEDTAIKTIEAIWNSDAVDDRFAYYGAAPTVWQSSNFAIGCFRYGKGDYGWKVVGSCAACPTALTGKMMGAFSTINPDPRTDKGSNDNKILYSWCAGPYLESILKGLCGIDANAFADTVEFRPYVPPEWTYMRVGDFRFGSHTVDFCYQNGEWKISHRVGRKPIRLISAAGGSVTQVEIEPGEALDLTIPTAIGKGTGESKLGRG